MFLKDVDIMVFFCLAVLTQKFFNPALCLALHLIF